jgi:hypothetical protein
MSEKYSADKVQALADDFIRFKRYVEDALENLPSGTMTEGSVKKLIAKYGETSSAGFEAYADAEKAIAEMFAKYEAESAMTIASIKATSDTNRADISLLASRVDGTSASISGIQQQADANGAFINMFAVASPFGIDASKGYTYDNVNNEYVFKNSKNENVIVRAEDFAGIYINAMNNGSVGDTTKIKLNASVIQLGDNASVDNNGNFFAKKLWGDSSGTANINGVNYPGFFYTEVGSGYTDENGAFVGGNLFIKDIYGTTMYGFDHKFTEGEDSDSVNFVAGGKSAWGYNYVQRKLYPKGTWDFSVCSVEGLGLVPVFG